MAIARGPGTEIIRSHLFEALTGDGYHTMVLGVQHHIYTVLSVQICCLGLAATTHYVSFGVYGYDSFGGTTTEWHQIFKQIIAEGETFVWNDKFSFNGCEPTNFTGPMSTVAEQDLIADQAESGIPQELRLYTSAASTTYDVIVTFLDQNNA